MIRIGVLDHPVQRSAHTRPVPKGGGVGIIGSVVVLLPLTLLPCPGAYWAQAGGLWLGMILLAIIAWLDDIYSFAALYKLAAQISAGVLVAAPLSQTFVGLMAGVALTVFITNALNFIDGLNGLAAGSMAITSLFLVFFLAFTGAPISVFILLGLALVTFLPFNFPRARIFMGDVGSQAAALAISWSAMLPVPQEPGLTLLLLAAVLWDVLFTLYRRFRAGSPLMQAHNGHLYQLAVRSGLSAIQVTLIYWAFTLWSACVWWALIGFGRPPGTGIWATAALLVLIPIWAWTGYIGYRARRERLTPT